MLATPVVSSAACSGGSRRRLPRAAARPAAGVHAHGPALTVWLMVLVALGAFVGALTCAGSVGASSHHQPTSIAAEIAAEQADENADENVAHAHEPGHGAHRSIERAPLGEPSTDDIVGHPGLACVVAIDLACRLVNGVLIAGPPVAVVAPIFAGCPSEPDPPVPRCSPVLAS